MDKKDCGLEKECMEFLCEFPDRIPYRCRLCTPMVRFVLERLKEMHKDKHAVQAGLENEPGWWNNGAYDD